MFKGDFARQLTAPCKQEGAEPQASVMTAAEVFAPSLDCQWVDVSVVVKAMVQWDDRIVFDVDLDGWRAQGTILSRAGAALPPWFALEQTLRLRGVASTIFNDRRQMTGRHFHVPDFSCLVPETSPPTLDAGPLRQPEELLQADGSTRERVRVRGIVTAVRPGAGLYLRTPNAGLFVRFTEPLAISEGATVEAKGYPEFAEVAPNLRAVYVQPTGFDTGPFPRPVNPHITDCREHHELGRVCKLTF